MKIEKQQVKLGMPIDVMSEIKKIERAARNCYKSEDKIDENSYSKIISNCIKHGHYSILEHTSVTFFVVTNRAIANQIVRHRTGVFSQESTRYCNYNKDKFGNSMRFIKPETTNEECFQLMLDSYSFAEKKYKQLIEKGISPEVARDILPLGLSTSLYVTFDLRGWRNFLNLRLEKSAQLQIREIAKEFLLQLYKLFPIIFLDIKEKYGY